MMMMILMLMDECCVVTPCSLRSWRNSYGCGRSARLQSMELQKDCSPRGSKDTQTLRVSLMRVLNNLKIGGNDKTKLVGPGTSTSL